MKRFVFNAFAENCYLLWDKTGEGFAVDPGCMHPSEREELLAAIKDNGVKLKGIILTHGHFDHIFGVKELTEKLGATVYMHAADKVLLEGLNNDISRTFGLPDADGTFDFTPIKEGDVLQFGDTRLEVIETPGHTPGGVCFHDVENKRLFTGDTLFCGTIGRTDTAVGNYDKLIVSIMDKLMGFDGDTDVFPGHGPATSIGYERTHNPFLQPFNESEEEFE